MLAPFAVLEAAANNHALGIVFLMVLYGLLLLYTWQNRRPRLSRDQLLASVKQWLDAKEPGEAQQIRHE
jgi:hypothetical protein